MTPKEQYEARKAERKKLQDMDDEVRKRTEPLLMLDMLDRFVTAVERIADATERPQGVSATLGPQPIGFGVANTYGRPVAT